MLYVMLVDVNMAPLIVSVAAIHGSTSTISNSFNAVTAVELA